VLAGTGAGFAAGYLGGVAASNSSADHCRQQPGHNDMCAFDPVTVPLFAMTGAAVGLLTGFLLKYDHWEQIWHAPAATSTCRVADSTALTLRSYLRQLVTSTDPDRVALRIGIGLAAMDSTTIVQVTNSRVCDNVANGMNAALKTPNLARNLYVFSVGRSFAAQDPDRAAGEWLPLMIVDSKYAYLGSVLAQ
jgi:hypothetical protein